MKEEPENLAIVEPMPLWPGDAFWDQQPRHNDGRFDHGKMPEQYLQCPAKGVPRRFREATRYDDILNALVLRHSTKEWKHPDVGGFLVAKAGLRHAVRTRPSKAKNIALWHLDRIIQSITHFHVEKPHEGKNGIIAEHIGTVLVSIGKSTYSATVTIEEAGDGVKRFHHLRLDKNEPPRQRHGGEGGR